MGCIETCSFTRLLSVNSNFTNFNLQNTDYFAKNAVSNLPGEVASNCVYIFPSLKSFYANIKPSSLLDNIGFNNIINKFIF